jgi:carbon storage regulator
MLVLSRKVSERIWIGEEICVTIVRINANTVRIGIDAPPHLAVVRDELRRRESAAPPADLALCDSQEPS